MTKLTDKTKQMMGIKIDAKKTSDIYKYVIRIEDVFKEYLRDADNMRTSNRRANAKLISLYQNVLDSVLDTKIVKKAEKFTKPFTADPLIHENIEPDVLKERLGKGVETLIAEGVEHIDEPFSGFEGTSKNYKNHLRFFRNVREDAIGYIEELEEINEQLADIMRSKMKWMFKEDEWYPIRAATSSFRNFTSHLRSESEDLGLID